MDMDQHNFDKWAHQAFAALPKNNGNLISPSFFKVIALKEIYHCMPQKMNNTCLRPFPPTTHVVMSRHQFLV